MGQPMLSFLGWQSWHKRKCSVAKSSAQMYRAARALVRGMLPRRDGSVALVLTSALTLFMTPSQTDDRLVCASCVIV